MNRMTVGFSLLLLSFVGAHGAEPRRTAEENPSYGIVLREYYRAVLAPDGSEILRYVTKLPADSKLSVKSAGYIHPLRTPKGQVVTDVAPEDHRHHRGVFLAFVEMHGKQDADFWGWGEHAPMDDRVIECGADLFGMADHLGAYWGMSNVWRAKKEAMVDEGLFVAVRRGRGCNNIILTYRLTPKHDTRLARWAFSGFCVRLRKDGEITYTSPEGVVKRDPVNHLKPESNWPAADWYDATVKLKDGGEVGVTVVDHPDNPPTWWHNEGRIHMLNPCIVAPKEIKLSAGKPLELKYQLIVHDGPLPRDVVTEIAKAFRKK